MTGISLLVVETWQPAYRRPLVLSAGDRVTVGQQDTEWTSYRWCTNEAGTSGWVPHDYLVMEEDGTATSTVHYSTAELSVDVDAVVTGFQAAGDWTWCVADSGAEGWVPNRALSRLP
jgi:uncharacterized protein YraI